MSGLAKYLLENGCEVSGSDLEKSKYIEKLYDLGATISIGHDAKNVPSDAIVVASTAIRESNPEIIRAKELGLKIYHRSDVLAEISSWEKYFIGFSGTHGKTTTSGFCSYILEKSGHLPSYVVGGTICDLGYNSKCQQGKHFVAELDESDGTIVKYAPNICVVNNIEADHLDFFEDGMNSILKTFKKCISNMDENGILIVNNDCEVAKTLNATNLITFGLKEADYVAKNIKYNEEHTSFDVYYKNKFLIDLKIILKGQHNVYNALSVLTAIHQAGIDIHTTKEHFTTFAGMGRRFEKVGKFNDIILIDDYAHHPTEIKATLSSAKNFVDNRIVAVFQPHRYTRLKGLWEEFLSCFDGADLVIVTDIYEASEDPIEGINAETFTKELEKNGVNTIHIPGKMKELASKLLPKLQKNDVVIGMGAGTITDLGKELLKLSQEVLNV